MNIENEWKIDRMKRKMKELGWGRHVETLNYDECEVRTMVASRYVKNLMIPDTPKLQCPRCGEIEGEIERGNWRPCSNCKLYMKRLGNALEIWEQADD